MKLTLICVFLSFSKASPLMREMLPKTSNIEVDASGPNPPVLTIIDERYDGDDPEATIYLSESMMDFSKPIASYLADSQIPGEPTVFFELRVEELSEGIPDFSNPIFGDPDGEPFFFKATQSRTEQTNETATFKATRDKDNQQQINIYLVKPLQYEKVDSYSLTLQVKNIADLVAEAQLNVRVEDENNQAPIFKYIESGKVLEHEAPGTFVMRVNAIDNDGTFPNNRVTYSISDEDQDILDKFSIHPDAGIITTKVELDCEEKAVYEVTILAKDGDEGWSTIINSTPQKFRIDINDKKE